jgi:hypothetical protein
MLVFWVCDAGFEMVDAIQRQLVVAFRCQAYRWWNCGSKLIGRDIAIEKLLLDQHRSP